MIVMLLTLEELLRVEHWDFLHYISAPVKYWSLQDYQTCSLDRPATPVKIQKHSYM